MIIGVDAGCLGVKDKRLKVGVYRVTENLLEQLGKIDTKNNYLLYSFYPIEKELMDRFGKRMKNIIVKPSRGWAKIWLPFRLKIDKPQVFIGISQFVPNTFYKTYKIGIVHDIAFEIFPDMYSDYSRLSKNTKDMVTNSDCIISVSQATKDDLIKIYNADGKKIKIIHSGCSEVFSEKGEKIKSEKPYFLFVGSLKKIKNVPTLIKAFEYFCNNTNFDFELIIIGGNKWLDEEIDETLKKISKDIVSKIIFLGFLENEDLAKYYRNAWAFVSPSIYEGFGIPFLEAMKCGCPVIGSTSGSIKEVVGDAGILKDPKDVKGLGEAMINISKNEILRKKLIKKGIDRSKKFSWKSFAENVYKIIENVK